MRDFFRKHWKSFSVLLLLLVSVGYSVGLVQKAVEWITNATYTPAALTVYPESRSPMKRIWEGMAQGYESKELRLEPVTATLKAAGVQYIRIDHVFDGYDVVSRGEDGSLRYDFSKLDLLVGDILNSGARPFIALSYMPPAISKGDVVDMPRDWGEWGQVVAAMVGHYSRDFRGGISDVIYEVWNEPDLFGGWKTYGDKNYLTLYRTAVNAAESVAGAKKFLIGGPATTAQYRAWVTNFYEKNEGVRKDFYSWHRYSYDVDQYVRDVDQAVEWIAPRITSSQMIFITEWGPTPERDKVYDSRLAGAHMIAVVRALIDTPIDLLLSFEVMDGPVGEQWHGGWGMFTNPANGGLAKKPRMVAYEMLQKMKGERVRVEGDGTFVSAFGAIDPASGIVRVLVVNYDSRGRHSEVFPVHFADLQNGSYRIKESYLSGRVVDVPVAVDAGNLRREYSLEASDAILIELSRTK